MTMPQGGRGQPAFEQAAQDTLAAVRQQPRQRPLQAPPMSAAEQQLAAQVAADEARICRYCVGIHRFPTSVGCPRIASAELNSDGTVKAMTFWPGRKWAKGRVVFIEDMTEVAEQFAGLGFDDIDTDPVWVACDLCGVRHRPGDACG